MPYCYPAYQIFLSKDIACIINDNDHSILPFIYFLIDENLDIIIQETMALLREHKNILIKASILIYLKKKLPKTSDLIKNSIAKEIIDTPDFDVIIDFLFARGHNTLAGEILFEIANSKPTSRTRLPLFTPPIPLENIYTNLALNHLDSNPKNVKDTLNNLTKVDSDLLSQINKRLQDKINRIKQRTAKYTAASLVDWKEAHEIAKSCSKKPSKGDHQKTLSLYTEFCLAMKDNLNDNPEDQISESPTP